jgi:hypothetical protein
MNEFVLVTFDGTATVYVDGTECGKANKRMIVETGTHIFDLGDRDDYLPKSITQTIVGTSADDPFPLLFNKV